MANSVNRYRGNVSMAWIPMQLMGLNLKNNIGWAQVVKQFIVLVSGIETKSQDEMDKGARENHILSEYSRWVEIMNEVWIKPTDGSYFFKKSHAVAYAQAIVVQMNLISKAKYSFDAPSKT